MFEISEENINNRIESFSDNSQNDYISDGYRRIFPDKKKLLFENKIFNDRIGICLQNTPLSIEIKNCDFKKGLFIRRGETDIDFDIFIFRCNISSSIVLHSFEARSKISIDNTQIEELIISGKSDEIKFYRTEIGALNLEFLSCSFYSMERSRVKTYSMYNFTAHEVELDTDDIAISDMSRFKCHTNQTIKQTSEVYHRFALKAGNLN